jgi:hypothetical protein
LPYDLRVNTIQLRPDFSGQTAVYRRDFFRVCVPAVVQPALDCLIGFYLVAKELYSGLPAMPAGVQSAGHGLENLMFTDGVIDGLAARVLDGRDIPGEEKTLDDQFEQLAWWGFARYAKLPAVDGHVRCAGVPW